MSLRAPPKPDRPQRLVVKGLTLILMVALVGLIIWAAVTNQNIEKHEIIRQEDLSLVAPAVVGDDVINVVHHGLGSPQVILLHDVEVSGSAIWEPVIDELGIGVTAVTIDLPGFGLSTRHPEIGPEHTVSSMAEVVAEIVEERFPQRPVIFVGVGLGAEVSAEIAVTRPELLSGLVMVDADFYASDGFLRTAEQWPFIGPALTHAFHGGGAWYDRYWSPKCGDGGWCPTRSMSESRDRATRIIGTNDSLRAFLRTPPSSLVPSLLDQITIPATFIVSTDGPVSKESVERVVDAIPGLDLIEVEVWRAILEAPDVVADAILGYGA